MNVPNIMIISAILVSLLTSFAGKVDIKALSQNISPTISEPSTEVKMALVNQPQLPLVKIIVDLDKSDSGNWNRLRQPQLTNFHLLSVLLKINGGELAVGTVCDDSSRFLEIVIVFYTAEDWPPELYEIILLIAMAILAYMTNAGVVYGFERYQNAFGFFWLRINHFLRQRKLQSSKRIFYEQKHNFFVLIEIMNRQLKIIIKG